MSKVEFGPTQEPASYRILRGASTEVIPKDRIGSFNAVLSSKLGLSDIGPDLVRVLGSRTVLELATEVGRLAEAELHERPGYKVAENASRWARRAKKRITQDRQWVNPEPDRSRYSRLW